MKLILPDSNDEKSLLGDAAPVLVQLDLEALLELQQQPKEYGQLLSTSLLAHPAARAGMKTALDVAASQELALRVRLNLGGGAHSELHALRWETLVNLETQSAIGMSHDFFLSRFLGSGDLRPIRLRSRSELRVLVAIANPIGLDKYGLTCIDVKAERAMLAAALDTIPFRVLSDDGPVTLSRICEACDNEPEGYDVLYIVCHGTFAEDTSYLFLETDDRQVMRTSGTDLAVRIHDLQHRPNLIVLASCQSASSQQGQALSAVAPRLARAGIPAVLAMQDEISIDTSREFMNAFFTQLQANGQVDEAVSVARRTVSAQDDWWVPMLLMRLRTGAIWYERQRRGEFQKWETLKASLEAEQCIPVIGPGVREALIGSSRELSQYLGEQYDFPLAAHDAEDLPQVMQYLANDHDERFARVVRNNAMRRSIMRRFQEDLGDDVRTRPLDELLRTAWRARDAEHADAHRILAQLPCRMYITANPDDLLPMALTETPADRYSGKVKEPVRDHCDWNHAVTGKRNVGASQRGYEPTVARPLVYHLFGRSDIADSEVVTEANYLDYLIAISKQKDRIPSSVWKELAEANLLFIGFDINDWTLRVITQTIMNLEGTFRSPKRTNIAVQIDPESGAISDPERTRRYLEKYFRNNDLQIYWGSVDEFMADLRKEWRGAARAA